MHRDNLQSRRNMKSSNTTILCDSSFLPTSPADMVRTICSSNGTIRKGWGRCWLTSRNIFMPGITFTTGHDCALRLCRSNSLMTPRGEPTLLSCPRCSPSCLHCYETQRQDWVTGPPYPALYKCRLPVGWMRIASLPTLNSHQVAT